MAFATLGEHSIAMLTRVFEVLGHIATNSLARRQHPPPRRASTPLTLAILTAPPLARKRPVWRSGFGVTVTAYLNTGSR